MQIGLGKPDVLQLIGETLHTIGNKKTSAKSQHLQITMQQATEPMFCFLGGLTANQLKLIKASRFG